jgi:hypothetical protein
LPVSLAAIPAGAARLRAAATAQERRLDDDEHDNERDNASNL